METPEYEFIVARLNKREDVDVLNQRMGYPKDMLYNILGKKIVRSTLKLFYVIKRKEPQLLKRWLYGESIVSIADSIGFSPILTATFILVRNGMTKKKLREVLKNPDCAGDARISREIREAIATDFVYSPVSHQMQEKNGLKAEDRIKVWLDRNHIKYRRQAELVGKHVKTPDFLLDKPIELCGHKVCWIESKSSFGDKKEMFRDYKKQLLPYLQLFDTGAVVYAYGFLEDVKVDDKILFLTAEPFVVAESATAAQHASKK
jgi:hypothetical protein